MMSKPIIVNVQSYGDFDIESTDFLMVAPEGMTKVQVAEIVKEAYEEFKNTNDSEKVKTYLKHLGFKTSKYFNLVIGGNL